MVGKKKAKKRNKERGGRKVPLLSLSPSERAEHCARFIAKHNYEKCGDTLDIKFGGDGDVGEELIISLTEYFKKHS